MVLKLYNSYSKKIEEFKPLHKGVVNFYSCGPTVNNYLHLGHARTYIPWDIIRRYLIYKGYKVKFVSNITDIAIDDKILKELKKNNMEFNELTEKFRVESFKDRKSLGIMNADINPLATQHVSEMIEMIEVLIKKGYAYETSDGVYFSINKFKNYGRLSGINPEQLLKKTCKRIKEEEYDKGVIGDFVLWKKHKKGEPYWFSRWGKGRPGWHIECSAMSMKYLGETLDIHSGGEDNKFPHHENEIAQSEAYSGKTFSKYWLHTKSLRMNGEKMSKSKGNFITIKDGIKKYSALLIRFFIANTHYRKIIDFNEKDLLAQNMRIVKIKKAINFVVSQKEMNNNIKDDELIDLVNNKELEFCKAMDDDFNTNLAIKNVYDLVQEVNKRKEISKKSSIKVFDFFKRTLTIILGDLFNSLIKKDENNNIINLINDLNKYRTILRKEKNYEVSDKIRDILSKNGFKIND